MQMEKEPKKSFSSTRTSFTQSIRKRLRSFSSSTTPAPPRPQISAPSNFRHLHSESFNFPQYTQLRNVSRRPPIPPQFRPIELSIYMPQNRLSPILPLFDLEAPLPPLPGARYPEARSDDFSLDAQRSCSSMSFHIPRKPASSLPSLLEDSPPRIPPKARARAYTSPNVDQMKERIASSMIEVEKLQKEIDSVIERQSIYAASSRPSTAYSMALTGKHSFHHHTTTPIASARSIFY